MMLGCAHLLLRSSEKCFDKLYVSSRIAFVLHPRWCPSGWSPPEVTEAQSMNVLCLLPQGKWSQTCHVSTRNWSFEAVRLIRLPNIPKVTESSVTFGQLWNLWGWPRRGTLKTQRCVCQPPALCPVSYSWLLVATPCPRLHRQFGQNIISVN